MREELKATLARREFIRRAAAGTVIVAFGGGLYVISDDLTKEARAQGRGDGRSRVPPGQRVIDALKPMGGEPGEPSPGKFRLKVHGEVQAPYELDFAALLALGQVDLAVDVHCV